MAYDLLIKNAQICDGAGTPVYGGGLAVSDGKIVEIGKVSGSARREINADGLVLAPGFIDIHTHYDAQISWDPLADQLVLARGHLGVDGQLRRGGRAVSSGRARDHGLGFGQRRGHAV